MDDTFAAAGAQAGHGELTGATTGLVKIDPLTQAPCNISDVKNN
jgi:hypothetical protein